MIAVLKKFFTCFTTSKGVLNVVPNILAVDIPIKGRIALLYPPSFSGFLNILAIFS